MSTVLFIKDCILMNINKIISVSKNYEKNISEFENGKLIVKENLEAIVFKDNIDWNYTHVTNSRTYQVYLHSLNIIKDFVQMYLSSNNEKYLMQAVELIKDWYKKNMGVENTNLSWNEHAVSYRILNIIYFQENAGNSKLPQKIFNKIIDSHINYLNDDTNYKDNNHGIMMDNSLLVSSYYCRSNHIKNLIISKVYYRLNYSIRRDFSYQGLHLENSPEYHRLVLTLLNRSRIILEELGRPFTNEIIQILANAKKLNSIIIKPNREFPLIGDTGTIVDRKVPKSFVDFIDYEAGITVLNKKKTSDISMSTWFVLKSGYQSKTHKHLDDLSINLFMDGHDIFVDSGKYNYENNNSERQRIISPEGHSTLLVENKHYKLTNPQKDQLKLAVNKYINKNKYKLVSAKNNMYPSTYLSRTCVLTKSDELIIYDSINSKLNQNYTQNYIMNPDAKVVKIDNTKFEIEINNIVYVLETRQRNNEKVESKIIDTKISTKFGHLTNTKQLKFIKEGYVTNFITLFYKKENEQKITEIYINKGKIVYKLNGETQSINL